jgi:hypothetical protein
MARVTTAGLLGNITGSLAGTTFQNGVSGQIIRKKPIPKKSFNNAQQNIRLIQTQLNYEWSQLTESERAMWDGKIGTAFKTGKNAYLNANFYRVFYGQSIIDTPSYNPAPPPLDPTSLTYDSPDLLLENTGSVDLGEFMVIVKMSYPVGQTVTKSRNNLRLLNISVASPVLIDMSPTYENTVHVTPAIGMKIWVSCAVQHRTSGDVSPFTTKLLTVLAP